MSLRTRKADKFSWVLMMTKMQLLMLMTSLHLRQIIPWNFPILMYAWKVGPTLACRNSIVLKNVEHTPLFALYVSKRFHETGLPLSMLNIVYGSLASHIDVDKDPLKLVELCSD